ncbi:MAG: hypothetical protein LN546_02585 [Rickettsia endosymbiont of Ecitomorpha arachnoides]|nr:hypothetical protein [Rickettsia endosymbiont of Sceptobius lativentris]MCC8462060.1 hypothetical protein [Rickettsia endosymbiont of Ecitomorpha arachnoides]
MYKELIEAIIAKDTIKAQELINEMDISELMADDEGSTLLDLMRNNNLSSVCDAFIYKLTNQATSEINDYYKPLIEAMAENLKNMTYTFIDLNETYKALQNPYNDDDTDVLGR